jgi:hypothetical protein
MVSWRNSGMPVRVVQIVLRGSLLLTFSGFMGLSLQASDGISTVQQNGRKVYVNSEFSPTPSAVVQPGQRMTAARYKYWSTVEHCWKYVPRPTQAALSAARSAAADVASFVSTRRPNAQC